VDGRSVGDRDISARVARTRILEAVTMGRGSTTRSKANVEMARLRRVRRLAATAIGGAGALDVISAVTPPLRDRLHELVKIVPLAVPQVATSLVVLAGIGLLMLARGVRLGQRRAWLFSVALLAGSAVLHLVKGADVEETVMALALTAWMLHVRRRFDAPPSHVSPTLGVVAALALVTVTGVAATELFPMHAVHPSLGAAVTAVFSRLVGLQNGKLAISLDRFLTPVLRASGLAAVVIGGAMLFRAAHFGRKSSDLARARRIVARHGGDTLAYFALRADKAHFFDEDTVVAFAVIGGVCLVSPDPVGPAEQREAAWEAFQAFAAQRGWTVGVLGAGEEWLSVYHGSGMSSFYVGDEAVVDCTTFRLDGGKFKGLRQAVNRIAKYGYTIEFFDPAHVDPELQTQLRALLDDSRQGEAERGFSMTLGRLFDPDDVGLLLSVTFDPNGVPVAFCQWVPSPSIDGFSLDLMRRSRSAEHPNGLTDFVVVRTIEYLREQGRTGLALNFATLRTIVSGSSGDGFTETSKRWVLRRLSDSMQIESLWRYNAKFEPEWRPRFAVYESKAMLLPAALAAAKAEAFSDIPVIGRFFRPDPDLEPDRPALAPTATGDR